MGNAYRIFMRTKDGFARKMRQGAALNYMMSG